LQLADSEVSGQTGQAVLESSSAQHASVPIQTAPPWPPTPPPELVTGAFICVPYRDYIETQLDASVACRPVSGFAAVPKTIVIYLIA
jgi:hypothetical protein